MASNGDDASEFGHEVILKRRKRHGRTHEVIQKEHGLFFHTFVTIIPLITSEDSGKKMPSASHLKIETLLRGELEHAATNLDADRANRSNWEAYGKAAQRFNDFILNGKIPADFVSLPAAAGTSGT